jgi:hypothetical protein
MMVQKGLAQEISSAEEISPAKAQRRNALPRFYGFSLRLCAFAGENFFIYVPTLTFCAKAVQK